MESGASEYLKVFRGRLQRLLTTGRLERPQRSALTLAKEVLEALTAQGAISATEAQRWLIQIRADIYGSTPNRAQSQLVQSDDRVNGSTSVPLTKFVGTLQGRPLIVGGRQLELTVIELFDRGFDLQWWFPLTTGRGDYFGLPGLLSPDGPRLLALEEQSGLRFTPVSASWSAGQFGLVSRLLFSPALPTDAPVVLKLAFDIGTATLALGHLDDGSSRDEA